MNLEIRPRLQMLALQLLGCVILVLSMLLKLLEFPFFFFFSENKTACNEV